MNREQFKHLEDRLTAAYRTLRNAYKEPRKPADVIRAERTVLTWERREEAKRKAYRDKVDKRVRVAREAMYFDDPTKALASVKKLEIEASSL